MAEADLLYQLSIITDRLWSIHQWWASISFGLIALAHVASTKLNRALLTLIICLYSFFSFWIYGLISQNEATLGAYISDLSLLYQSGVTPSAAGLVISSGQSTLVIIARFATLGGTFIGCIAYLVYSHKKGQSSQ